MCMSKIPSFKDYEALKKAVIVVLEKSTYLNSLPDDRIIHFMVVKLMSDDIAIQASRISRYRQFGQLVEQQWLALQERLAAILKVGDQVLHTFKLSDSHIKDDFKSILRVFLLKPPNEGTNDYLFGEHTRSFIRYKITYLLKSYLRDQRKTYSREVEKTDQDLIDEGQDPNDFKDSDKKRPTKLVNVVKSVESLGSSAEEDFDYFERYENPNEPQVNDLEALIHKESRDLQIKELLEHVITLPKSRRSAFIAREWPVLSAWGNREELADYVHSPLALADRIKVLDEVEDNQRRMVRVSYPDLDDDEEIKLKLPTLNRASRHAFEALEKLLKSTT